MRTKCSTVKKQTALERELNMLLSYDKKNNFDL